MSCYRDTSVLMHAGVVALDAAKQIKTGQPIRAATTMFRRSVVTSLRAVIETTAMIRALSHRSANRRRSLPTQRQSAVSVPPA
jgi:hypothetical protein